MAKNIERNIHLRLMRRHVSIRERYLPKVLQLCRNIISVIRARRKPRGTFSTHFHRYHSERRESKKWNAIRNAITAALNCVRLTVSKALLQILFYLALFFLFSSLLSVVFSISPKNSAVFFLCRKKKNKERKRIKNDGKKRRLERARESWFLSTKRNNVTWPTNLYSFISKRNINCQKVEIYGPFHTETGSCTFVHLC